MAASFFEQLSVAELRRRRGIKWRQYPEDVLPAWIADLDFPTAPPVERAIQRLLERGDLGYPVRPWLNPLRDVYSERMQRLAGWAPDPQQVRLLTDVMSAVEAALLYDPERSRGGVIVQPPIYPPFLDAVARSGRERLENPLALGRNGWQLDLDGLRSAAAGARTLLLCNPHNPTGRAFTRAELESIGEIAIEHDLLIVSDEIHQDLIYDGRRHVPIASLGPELESRTVTLTSATKTFNIAGLCCAVGHVGPEPLRRALEALPIHLLGRVSIAGIEATLAAWTEGQAWADELLAHLRENRDRVAAFVAERLPGIRCHSPEATYLAWLDCRDLPVPGEPWEHFLEHGRVALSPGPDFGDAGRGFVRLNFATSRAILEQILERMAAALEELGQGPARSG